MDLGTLLRICRQRKRLNQSYVARMLHIDRAEVSRIENNQRPVTIQMLQKWAEVTESGDIIGWYIADMLGADARRWERVLRYEAVVEQLKQTLYA
ncbi:hypothetical protein GCM10025857_07170 [Alicyclobacillus contaminans]|uniref:helix-turn-helix domain-containing protein n=1 Tax=Alicyclobacillus contaminans TaxID=392016 RepID=UPI00047AF965|nr:helix-turn-helix transcriptional regulator [Alicyclobacillus contaminans]GMA49360.1 hypothetical protein GCM10025857_07170 [Alicyclobacillus contaminans]